VSVYYFIDIFPGAKLDIFFTFFYFFLMDSPLNSKCIAKYNPIQNSICHSLFPYSIIPAFYP